MKESKSRVVVKGTFEAVLGAQEMLREKLIELRDENRPIHDETERSAFMRLIAHSSLGLGTNHLIRLHIPLEHGGGTGIRDHYEKVVRWAAKQTSNQVYIPVELQHLYAKGDYDRPGNIDISLLWDVLLDACFSVFPLALDRAMSMSKERDERTGDDEYEVD